MAEALALTARTVRRDWVKARVALPGAPRVTASARLLPLVLLSLLPRLGASQGVTTAAIQGTVSAEDGSPVAGATIHVVHLSSGRRWEVTASSAGHFFLEHVAIGGPYRVEARALGYAPEAKTGIVLALGQRLFVDFSLRPAAIELSPVTVSTTADRTLDRSRTGPSAIVPAAAIVGLPNLGRDFLTLTLLSPLVAISPSSPTTAFAGITFGGQSRLLNSFQIDGGVNHDLYTGGLPGRDILPRPVSPEAIQEIHVLVAPFDVRHGAFAGGLVNAVTKSGANAVHGSWFAFLADAAFVGTNADGDEVGSFTTWQYGLTIGGPIVRDRAHYFLSLDGQQRAIPDPGPLITDTAGGADLERIGISYESATQFQDVLRTTYGLDPGTLGPVDQRLPARDVVGKVTVQLGRNSHLEASHHYARGERQGFLTGRGRGQYWLSSTDRHNRTTANASRLIWTSLLGGRWSSELIASYLRLRDMCQPAATFPFITVLADGGQLRAGTPPGCPPSAIVQSALEVTENLTVGLGAHVVTLGAHGEMLRFTDDQLGNSAGVWFFPNLAGLQAGQASQYDRALRGPSAPSGVEFRARQIGLYAQDRWNPTSDLTLTLGLRLDVPLLHDAVGTNDSLKAALGIDTGRLPSGNPLWSPRLGFSYNLRGGGHTFLRGGIGLFSGRAPYSWLGSAYRGNGAQELFLRCTGSNVPAFDPLNQPDTCANGAGPRPQLAYFDPDVRFPQNLKVALGVEHRFPGGVDGTVDVLYNRALHQHYLSDANLLPPERVAQGEGNRSLYGTHSATGVAAPARRDTAFGQVVRVYDRGGDYAFSLSAQFRKRLPRGIEVSALYAYSRARDRISIVNLTAATNFAQTPLDGTLEERRLRTSSFEIPHRVHLTAVVPLRYGVRLALSYAGASGTPFTYVIQGDANADGIPSAQLANDIMYVPRNRADMSMDGNGGAAGFGTAAQQDSVYSLLDDFIRAEPCLANQRGPNSGAQQLP